MLQHVTGKKYICKAMSICDIGYNTSLSETPKLTSLDVSKSFSVTICLYHYILQISETNVCMWETAIMGH